MKKIVTGSCRKHKEDRQSTKLTRKDEELFAGRFRRGQLSIPATPVLGVTE